MQPGKDVKTYDKVQIFDFFMYEDGYIKFKNLVIKQKKNKNGLRS